jgi:glycosyltransferase involved in cell wall biosynthesis
VILALVDYYLPGYKGGGPITTLAGMVERLGAEFRFRVVTRDRDLGDPAPYPGVRPGAVTPCGGAEAVYLSPGMLRPRPLLRALAQSAPRVLYLNSLFSPHFTLKPLLLRRRSRALARVPVVLAPRGELSPGALRLKGRKKRAFLALARAAGLYRGVLWQASSGEEADEVRRWFPGAEVMVAPDLAPAGSGAPPPARHKAPGELRAAFLSRISPKKNLLGALDLLAAAGPGASLDVYGPAEDEAYWARCRARIAALPAGVEVRVHGPVPPVRVPQVLGDAHVLLLPTLGENYGHVVLEALRAGCLPVISDRTPWRGLAERGVGWDLPLDDARGFAAALAQVMAMDADAFSRASARASAFGESVAADPVAEEQNRALLRAALARAAG